MQPRAMLVLLISCLATASKLKHSLLGRGEMEDSGNRESYKTREPPHKILLKSKGRLFLIELLMSWAGNSKIQL